MEKSQFQTGESCKECVRCDDFLKEIQAIAFVVMRAERHGRLTHLDAASIRRRLENMKYRFKQLCKFNLHSLD
jgi:hypothetical protein